MVGEKTVIENLEVTESTNPIDDLGLDSPDGIDFILMLDGEIDIAIPGNVNPFIIDDSKDGRKSARSVGQITDLILSLLSGKVGG
jgi:acyl carrier protein